MTINERKNSIIGMEFDRYIREHPDFIEKLPQNAHIGLLMSEDAEFNKWSTNLAHKQAEKNQKIVLVTIKEMAPAHSRIKNMDFEIASS
ncbi:hypothetical protein H8E88_27030 [candidate division KSB1 bacterium]|nr:hypothetical protein [candidate division KSB1 bacterium]MBL7092794.1 hypothetical protein [candidate division KSB1 bacterium]